MTIEVFGVLVGVGIAALHDFLTRKHRCPECGLSSSRIDSLLVRVNWYTLYGSFRRPRITIDEEKS